jgi:hypothetical protein
MRNSTTDTRTEHFHPRVAGVRGRASLGEARRGSEGNVAVAVRVQIHLGIVCRLALQGKGGIRSGGLEDCTVITGTPTLSAACLRIFGDTEQQIRMRTNRSPPKRTTLLTTAAVMLTSGGRALKSRLASTCAMKSAGPRGLKTLCVYKVTQVR